MKKEVQYKTDGGVVIQCTRHPLPYRNALAAVEEQIDFHKGALFCSGYEYPGRYSRWDIGFVKPPIEIIGNGRHFLVRALNQRGKKLIGAIDFCLRKHPHVASLHREEDRLEGSIIPMPGFFEEEERSKQPGLFSILRSLRSFFGSQEDRILGLFGSFGYDLVFQFEPVQLKHHRPGGYADAWLFLPDQFYVVDHRRETAEKRDYDFLFQEVTTEGLPREGRAIPCTTQPFEGMKGDHQPGEYASKVESIRKGAMKGDFFEVVLSQAFHMGCDSTPSQLFSRIRKVNPSPYEFLINLGEQQLVGASPEMFVRVTGDEVETCPISGTIPRGEDPIQDADRLLQLLNSEKDKSELTMCTDVDRNDKSRICIPGSVQIIGRRLVEAYSRLFHTVDHVKGTLRQDCDAFDALLSHMWACTLTGAPKPAAMQRIEDLENSPREWYGGAIGFIGFDGHLNTGITIRFIHLRKGMATIRVGATLLADSEPEAEEKECLTKASAFIDAVQGKVKIPKKSYSFLKREPAPSVLFVDNRDSFVHTLANYFRQAGASVRTVRTGFPLKLLDERRPDMVFISPGPGTPEEMGVPGLVKACYERGLPVFGVCLGLQGMVQAFGGKLDLLPYPVHGKPSRITCAHSSRSAR